LVVQLREKFINLSNARKVFTKEERQAFLLNNPVCANPSCNTKLTMENYDIDHIVPHSAGGANDEYNLQALCKPCHKDKTREEQLNDEHIKVSSTYSSFNENVETILKGSLNQHLAFVEKLYDDEENDDDEFTTNPLDFGLSNYKAPTKQLNEYNIDINGCRRNQLYYNKNDIPLFTVMDQFKKYDGEKLNKNGLYYIETSLSFPFRGNGFYYYPLINLGLEKGLITNNDIKYVMFGSLTTKHDYYNGFIDWMNKNIPEHAKLAVNSMIGNFAVNKDNAYWKSLGVPENINEAYGYFIDYDGCFIDVKQSERGPFYHVFKASNKVDIETEKVLYDYIMDLEAVALYNLEQEIKLKGGVIMERKTDCIRFGFDGEFPFKLIDEKNIDGYYYDDNKTVPMYKLEINGRMKVQHKPKYVRTDVFNYEERRFKTTKDVDDNDFLPLIKKIIKKLGSCFITGIAGSGKTTLINQLKTYMTNHKITFTLLTPTNISAILIDGETLDKFAHKLRSKEIIDKLVGDYIIVDEISMCKEIFYKMLSVIKRFKPATKFILSGHFMQFLPVKDRVGDKKTKYYSQSEIFHDLTNSNIVELTRCRRSDDKHFIFCSTINAVKATDYKNEFCDLHICYTNVKRIELNKIMMDKQIEVQMADAKKRKRKFVKALHLDKNPYSNNSQDVDLFVSTPVIAITNKKDEFVNAEKFVVDEIKTSVIQLKNDRHTITVDVKDFQRWFHVAYAITSHRAQGLTINEPYTIHEWSRLSTRCKYVSLSRSNSWDNCNIID
jgi:hypothetical protein